MSVSISAVAFVLELVADDSEVLNDLLVHLCSELEVDSEVNGRAGGLADEFRLRYGRARVELSLVRAAVGRTFRFLAVLDRARPAVGARKADLDGAALTLLGPAGDFALTGKLERLVVEVLIDRQNAEPVRLDGFDLSQIVDEPLLGHDLGLRAAGKIAADDLDASFSERIEVGRRVDRSIDDRDAARVGLAGLAPGYGNRARNDDSNRQAAQNPVVPPWCAFWRSRRKPLCPDGRHVSLKTLSGVSRGVLFACWSQR